MALACGFSSDPRYMDMCSNARMIAVAATDIWRSGTGNRFCGFPRIWPLLVLPPLKISKSQVIRNSWSKATERCKQSIRCAYINYFNHRHSHGGQALLFREDPVVGLAQTVEKFFWYFWRERMNSLIQGFLLFARPLDFLPENVDVPPLFWNPGYTTDFNL